MTLWDWSLLAWARPGVSAAAIRLQDERGESVALLLWRAWAGETPLEVLAAASSQATDFEARVLAPLRQARRGLKACAELENLRGQVRVVELAAERALLDALAKLTLGAGGDAEAGFERLERRLGL